MVDTYLHLLNSDKDKINGEIFNVGFKNQSVNDLANDVREVLGQDIEIKKTETNDNRSYHVSSEKINNLIGFAPKYSVKDAVLDLKEAFENKFLTNTFEDEMYFNIKRMQSIKLT